MLLSLTYIIPAQAMANKPDYEKNCAVIKAYMLNTFTIENEYTQAIAFQADEKQYHENFKIIKSIFNATLLNKNPVFSARMKKEATQMTSTTVQNTQKASALEQYNMLSGYLKQQIKKDLDVEDKDQITQNRIGLKCAFDHENLEYLKSVQCSYGMDAEKFNSSVNTYLEGEYKKLPNSSSWCTIL